MIVTATSNAKGLQFSGLIMLEGLKSHARRVYSSFGDQLLERVDSEHCAGLVLKYYFLFV